MDSKVYWLNLLRRKLITASIAGSLYAVLFGVIIPNPFGEEISSVQDYLWRMVNSTPVYLLYSFPVILIYGTATSIVSDILANKIARNKNRRFEIYLTVLFHLLFGSVLLLISLTASILYLIVDRLLMKRNIDYKWGHTFKSLAVPFLLFVLLMGVINMVDFIENWTIYLQ